VGLLSAKSPHFALWSQQQIRNTGLIRELFSRVAGTISKDYSFKTMPRPDFVG
jgi:hypothetical protein